MLFIFNIYISIIFLFLIISTFKVHAVTTPSQCVAYTKVDNVCVTAPEFKAYYKRYEEETIERVGKGNWYFTLADKIQAAKELMVQKLLLHEAEKNKIEKTKYFKNYERDIKSGLKEIDSYIGKLRKGGKLNNRQLEELSKRLKIKLINGYKVKA